MMRSFRTRTKIFPAVDLAARFSSVTSPLNPQLASDTPFKRAFGRGGNSLRDLLNSIYDEDIKSVEKLDVVNKNLFPNRFLMYDVFCTLSSGEKIIVEIEKFDNRADIIPRLFGYMARDYSEQSEVGLFHSRSQNFLKVPERDIEKFDDTFKLVPVRIIGILDFQIDCDQSKCGSFIQRYGATVQKGQTASDLVQDELSRLLDFTILQLPLAPNDYESCETDAEKWSILMRDSDRFTEEINNSAIADIAAIDLSRKHHNLSKMTL
jgi:PD-(D/E)XK nuclease family transposase